MKTTWVKAAFAASAIYDAILAIALLFFTPTLFRLFGVELPNHLGYLQFPALLLLVFAAMYWKIASDPVAFRELIPYGMGLKASYIVIVFLYWFAGNVPWIWVPLAWIDLVFLALFAAAWWKGKPSVPMMV
jgi:hypothetical protein